MTGELASRLLGAGRSSFWAPEMNVFRWELIQRHDTGVGEGHALICDSQIRDWLLGKSTLDQNLVGAARLTEGRLPKLPEWPVDELVMWIDESLRLATPPRLRIIVVAPRGGGKRTFASAVARTLGMALLLIDSDSGTGDEANWTRFFLRAQRQVFLDTAAPVWIGERASQRRWPANQVLFPLQFVLCEPGVDVAPMAGVVDRVVRLPIPEVRTRERLWRKSSTAAADWQDDELRRLAEHHSVWPGDIERASYLGAQTPTDAAQSRARSRAIAVRPPRANS